MGRKRQFFGIGTKFGLYTIIATANPDSQGRTQYFCRCECGTEKTAVASHLKSGHVRSCGCLQKNEASQIGKANGIHYLSKTSEYGIWNKMIKRCNDSNDKSFKNYGGRGIKVCERWHKFENFLADMSLRPSRQHSLERKDNESGYNPSNCVWATREVQNSNQRRTRRITVDGVTMPVAKWAQEKNIPATTVYSRLNRGLSPDESLICGKLTPVKTHCQYGHPFDETNTYFSSNKRQCIACRKRRGKERYQKIRSVNAGRELT